MAGCVECEPEPVDASLEMELDDEEARTLPVLTSGGTRVALPTDAEADVDADASLGDPSVDGDADLQGDEGVEVPDSHGYLDVAVSISHRIERVDVRALSLEIQLDERPLSVDVTNVEGGSGWEESRDDRWRGHVGNGSVLRVWWSLDEPEHQRWLALADEADAAYEATLAMNWEHDSCSWQAQGTSEATFEDFVQKLADAGSLAPADDADVSVNETSIGFEADYEITTGLDLAIEDVQASGVYADAGPAGEVGGVVFPHVAHEGTGEDGVLQPNETLRVYSAAGPDAEAGYEASGLLAPVPTEPPGQVLLVVTVSYEPTDETASAEQQILAHLVEPGASEG